MPDSTMFRYFMFSQEHYNLTKNIEAKSGNKSYVFGKVYVGGYPKTFTSIVRNPETYTIRYGDAKVICSGDIRNIRYTEPS